MEAPQGKYAEVPKGWPPQTWGMHLARIEFMEAMGQAHYSRTDARWHVRRYRDQLLLVDRNRIIRILRKHKVANGTIEKLILDGAE